MKVTNNRGLPDAIVRAVENDPYDRPDIENYFSVTELIGPPRQRALKKRHAHELTEDASDRIWSLLGQAVHSVLERANANDLAEKRFFAKFGIYTLGGQIDTLELVNGVLTDYKVTTSWKFKEDRANSPDWVAQLNMQAELLRQAGHTVSKLQIVGILRDFSKLQAKRSQDYPQFQVIKVPIEMWSSEQTVSFINERIALHVEAEKTLPECSSEDRWAKPDIFAVMKNTRAIPGGLQHSKAAAEKMKSENAGTRIEFRPGVNSRCDDYCAVADKCTQYQALKSKNKSEVKEEVG